MAWKRYIEEYISNIAKAIRYKNGKSDLYTILQMPQAILNIDTSSYMDIIKSNIDAIKRYYFRQGYTKNNPVDEETTGICVMIDDDTKTHVAYPFSHSPLFYLKPGSIVRGQGFSVSEVTVCPDAPDTYMCSAMIVKENQASTYPKGYNGFGKYEIEATCDLPRYEEQKLDNSTSTWYRLTESSITNNYPILQYKTMYYGLVDYKMNTALYEFLMRNKSIKSIFSEFTIPIKSFIKENFNANPDVASATSGMDFYWNYKSNDIKSIFVWYDPSSTSNERRITVAYSPNQILKRAEVGEYNDNLYNTGVICYNNGKLETSDDNYVLPEIRTYYRKDHNDPDEGISPQVETGRYLAYGNLQPINTSQMFVTNVTIIDNETPERNIGKVWSDPTNVQTPSYSDFQSAAVAEADLANYVIFNSEPIYSKEKSTVISLTNGSDTFYMLVPKMLLDKNCDANAIVGQIGNGVRSASTKKFYNKLPAYYEERTVSGQTVYDVTLSEDEGPHTETLWRNDLSYYEQPVDEFYIKYSDHVEDAKPSSWFKAQYVTTEDAASFINDGTWVVADTTSKEYEYITDLYPWLLTGGPTITQDGDDYYVNDGYYNTKIVPIEYS